MQLTIQLMLRPTKAQQQLLGSTTHEYIALVNDVLDYAIAIDEMPKLSSKSVCANLPSALRNQCVKDARSVYRKIMKHGGKMPTLKKPVAIWNNQNYCIADKVISFPMMVAGKCQKVKVKAIIPADVVEMLSRCKLGAMRITKKSGKWVAQIAYEKGALPQCGTNSMGVDLGIKCPAVAVTSDGATKFYGNGWQNKYVRRRFAKRRKKLGKAKKLNTIRKSSNKEQRWMRDTDHKISRAIVNDAIAHGVGVIRLEKLSNIRSTARTSRKNNHSLHSWSFYRLAQYIEYKANLAGINVEYVNPAYTSQTCPKCGERHHAKDRLYVCPHCGYRSHRDRIGAVNILASVANPQG